MNVFVWIAAIVLGATFLVAAIAKVRDQSGTVEGAVGLGVSASVAPAVARVLPVLEVAGALMVLTPPVRRYGAVVCLLLLAAFSIAIFKTLRAGRAPICHCFGALSQRPIDNSLLVRNAALGLLAVAVLAGTP